MTIAITTVFAIVCIGLAIWFKKDSGFRPREFIAVSVFWILAAATTVGANVVAEIQQGIGGGVKTSVDTVDSVSNK